MSAYVSGELPFLRVLMTLTEVYSSCMSRLPLLLQLRIGTGGRVQFCSRIREQAATGECAYRSACQHTKSSVSFANIDSPQVHPMLVSSNSCTGSAPISTPYETFPW